MTLLYSRIVETYQKIEGTTKRLEITRFLVDLLKETPSEIIDKVVYLTQGKLHPDYLGIEIGIAEKLAIKALAIVTGVKESRISDEYRRRGDLGDAVEALLAGNTQVGLENERLTVEEVYTTLDRIAKSSGPGSVESKIRQLTSLISKSSPMEAKYVTRTALGRLRLGVADMTLLDALAHALANGKESKPLLEQAYNRSSDLGFVAKALATGGISAIKSFKVTVGRPIRPMLAERLSDPKQILEKMNGEAAAEYKYDGLRIQAHLTDRKVTLFSRRLENITDQFPDLHALLKKGIVDDGLILEGEAVPVDSSTGELLPFQLVSQRRGRKYELEKTIQDIPVALFAFDLLYHDGVDYTQIEYPRRREALSKLIRRNERLDLSRQIIVSKPEQLDDFMQQAVADGCEGLMIKSIGPDSIYKAGARGWGWIKYKREYKSEMQDTVDLTVVGAFAGRGRRGGTYGALLLAAYDEKDDVFRTACKCGSGFKDEDLAKLPEMMEKYKINHRHPRVDSKIVADTWLVPGLVLEVIGAEITLSPIHTCGMNSIRPGAGLAIRFPRFTGKYRTEKSPEDATTTKEIVEMYRNQLKKLSETQPVEAA
ncbi:MAG TPA: ATP-dependent DNA ligase [Candidatus Angelobacter sp.]|nr:ATP-dependent DNA ligase [Candidatus Angelobacter sp.]